MYHCHSLTSCSHVKGFHMTRLFWEAGGLDSEWCGLITAVGCMANQALRIPESSKTLPLAYWLHHSYSRSPCCVWWLGCCLLAAVGYNPQWTVSYPPREGTHGSTWDLCSFVLQLCVLQVAPKGDPPLSCMLGEGGGGGGGEDGSRSMSKNQQGQQSNHWKELV